MMDKNTDFTSSDRLPRLRSYRFIFLALFVLLATLYGSSLKGSWHFDDYKNIVNNPSIHLQTFSWENIKKASLGVPEENMKRPLAYLTFAVNYYLGGKDVFGYHLVNTAIHYVTALFLFFFILRTLNLPLFKERYGRHAYSIALLAAFFWAAHPIQVTAVTYIVQRMASLAAMFYMMALFFYLYARTADARIRRRASFILFFACAFFALAAKENAVTLPAAVLLADVLLIRGTAWKNLRKYLGYGAIPLILLVAGAWYYLEHSTFLDGYLIRPFTMEERLLTQPRIILYYVSLLLYPLSSRFAFLHDMTVSQGLFSPWTTFPAVMLVLSVPVLALFIARKRPLFSFCILFFFLNHLIEGSFLPLEMIYEHRNYLPSLFFFVPVAALAISGLEYFSRRKIVFSLLSALLIVFLAAEGLAVRIRNDAFRDELTFWLDNVEKAPGLHRPHHNLAKTLLAAGLLPEAESEFRLALEARGVSSKFQKYETYYFLGQCSRLKGDDDEALRLFDLSIGLVSSFPDVYQARAEVLMKRRQYGAAEKEIRKALYLNSGKAYFHRTYSQVLLKKGDPDGALKEAQKALFLQDNSPEIYEIMADIFQEKQDAARAAHFRLVSEKAKGSRP